MALIPAPFTAPVNRLGAAAQNALEVARFGGLATDEEPSPYEVAAEERVYKLRHYYAEEQDEGPAVLLVPPLMLAAEVYDVSRQTSAVTVLSEHGADPWVVDFGAPEREEGGLERTLADHVVAVSRAVDQVREASGRDVHLAGYSQGGMFCYQTAAYRRNDGLASVITFGSPVDTRAGVPFGLPEQFAAGVGGMLAERVFRGPGVPAWMSRTGFRLLDPVKSVRNQIQFLLQLHDREALLQREGQRRFLEADGWVAWPGPALVDFMTQFIAHNRMLEGGFVVDGRLVTLADWPCRSCPSSGPSTRSPPPPACARCGWPPPGQRFTSWRCGRVTSDSWLGPRRTRSPGQPWRHGRDGSRTGESFRRTSPRCATKIRRWSSRPPWVTVSATGSSWRGRSGPA